MSNDLKKVTGHSLNIFVAEVTPEQAATILDQNRDKEGKIKNYRKATPGQIMTYAAAMREKMWHLTGAALVFNKKGKLVDGQNRLLACIESGVSFTTLVIEGVEDKVIPYIDQGKSRTLADVLNNKGEDYSKELAIALRLVWLRTTNKKVSGGGKFDSGHALAMLKEHDALGESVAFVIDTDATNGGALKKVISLGYAAALHYLFRASEANGADTKADKFIRRMASDESIQEIQPVTKLISLILKSSSKETRLTRDGKLGACINAWVAYVDGNDVKTPSTLVPATDEFPRIGGLDEEPVAEDEVDDIGEGEDEALEALDEQVQPKRKTRKKKAATPEAEQAEADFEADGGE